MTVTQKHVKNVLTGKRWGSLRSARKALGWATDGRDSESRFVHRLYNMGFKIQYHGVNDIEFKEKNNE